MKNIFLFKAKDGAIDLGSDANRARFRDVLKKNEGKTFRIELMKENRTLSQNRYYRLFLEVCERETGQPADDIHEWGKRKFLPPRYIKVNGEEMKIPSTTTTLSKYEFGEYLDRLSSELEIALPDIQQAGYYCE